jgi:hypothetical protein
MGRILPEKTINSAGQKVTWFYVIEWFTNLFESTWYVSSDKWIQLTESYNISLRTILLLRRRPRWMHRPYKAFSFQYSQSMYTCINLWKPSGYYMHILEHCILPTQCVCVLHMVLTINSDSFHKRHEPVGLCSGDVTCFLWGTNWMFILS